jgi:tellurite methyltransferase
MDSRLKWNTKYIERIKQVSEPPVNPKLQQLTNYFSGGKALDIACGLGGNSVFLAQNNYQVTAIDISDVAINFLNQYALKNNLPIDARVGDLAKRALLDQNYDLVVMTYYLDRSLFPAIKDFLKTGGYFFMETYSQHQKNGISEHYKLRTNELLDEFAHWDILYFEENELEGRQTIFCRKL